MTVAPPIAPIDVPVPAAARRPWLADRLPDLAVLCPLLWWATSLMWGTGGREPHLLTVMALLLVIPLLVVRPWAVLPLPVYGLLTGIGVAAFGVVLTSPTGWHGAHDAAAYACAGQLAAVTLAWAGTAARRQALAGLVVAAAGLELARGWLGWWGGQNVARPFVGTFYWHNPAGIMLAAGALLGAGLVMARLPGLSALGWAVTPLCAAGTLFTTSRGSELALAGGWVALLVVAVALPGRRLLRTARHVALAAAAVATAVLLTSRVFFPTGTRSGLAAAGAATAARNQRENLGGNVDFRLENWRRGWAVFGHWPLSGAGFHSFNSAAARVTDNPRDYHTAFAHNGFLQVLSDGGLLLGLPVLAALVLLTVGAGRAAVRAWRRRDVLMLAGVTTLAVLALHSAIDFDWSYPSLLLTFALVAPLAVDAPRPPSVVRHRWLAASVGAAVLVLAAVAAWHGGLHLNSPVGQVG